jgi:drug/metabolite transporter (DMT)-like permease
VVAGGALYGLARATGAGHPTTADWRNAIEVGVFFFVIGHGLLAWGETRVASGAAAVLIATEPLFIVLLGWWGRGWFARARTPRPSASQLIGIALGLAGVAVLTLPGSRGALDPLGASALVAASLSWGVGTFRVAGTGSPMRAAGMQLLAGGTILFALAAGSGELARWEALPLERDAVLALLYLVVFGSVITFTAYVWLLREIGAARLASHTYVNPVIAVALGAALGGEAFGPRTLVASLMILTATLLLVRRSRKREPAHTEATSRTARSRAA